MLLVGLTGGIACGKSTVTAWFREQDIAVIDCDALVHDLQQPNTRCTRALAREFPGAVDAGGALDRAALGAAIFGDVAKRRRLDGLMRPFIAKALMKAIGYHACLGTSLVILDAPLLFEFKLDKLCALTVVVATSAETQLHRVITRDAVDAAAAAKRVAAQMPLAAKLERCAIVVPNDASVGELHAFLETRVVPRLRKRAWLYLGASLPGIVGGALVMYMFFTRSSIWTWTAPTMRPAARRRTRRG
jgi:dephospho-CoA kinase